MADEKKFKKNLKDPTTNPQPLDPSGPPQGPPDTDGDGDDDTTDQDG